MKMIIFFKKKNRNARAIIIKNKLNLKLILKHRCGRKAKKIRKNLYRQIFNIIYKKFRTKEMKDLRLNINNILLDIDFLNLIFCVFLINFQIVYRFSLKLKLFL